MPNYICEIPLTECHAVFFRFGFGFDAPMEGAHGLFLRIPSPPLNRAVEYTLFFPGAPDHMGDTSRRAPSGTGIHDLSLEGSIGHTMSRPLHFVIKDGMVKFCADSNLRAVGVRSC